MTHCVYKIENKVNNKTYIGVTSNFKHRMATHKHKPPTKMKDDFDIYSWESFSKEILFFGSEDYCYDMEDDCISSFGGEYNTNKGGFNTGTHGNGLCGEDHPLTKFSNKDAIVIRELYNTGKYNQIELANTYNTTKQTISRLILGRTYVEVNGPIQNARNKGLLDKEVIEVRNMYKTGNYKYIDIANKYNTTKSNIGKLVRGERRNKVGGPILGVDYNV